jgi:alpha-L-arabinofuranosidase
MAMIAGLVNVLAPIQTDEDRHHVTSAYLVGLLYRRLAGARALPVAVEAPTLRVPAMTGLDRALMMSTMARHDRESAVLDAAATTGPSPGTTTVFLTNRRLDAQTLVTVHGLGEVRSARVHAVRGPDLFARNRMDRPDVLGFDDRPVPVGRGPVEVALPPACAAALVVEGRPA